MNRLALRTAIDTPNEDRERTVGTVNQQIRRVRKARAEQHAESSQVDLESRPRYTQMGVNLRKCQREMLSSNLKTNAVTTFLARLLLFCGVLS